MRIIAIQAYILPQVEKKGKLRSGEEYRWREMRGLACYDTTLLQIIVLVWRFVEIWSEERIRFTAVRKRASPALHFTSTRYKNHPVHSQLEQRIRMWSAVARLASPAPRKVSTTQPLRADEATFSRLYDSLKASLSTGGDERPPSILQTVKQQLAQLLAILKVESATKEDGWLGPCIEYALREGVFKILVELVQEDEPRGVRLGLVEWFSRAIVELDEGFLAHSAVNKPL